MNEIITLPRLAEIIARTGIADLSASEKFIKVFFAHIEDSLAVSDSVSVDGLGSFFRTGNPDGPIRFVPDENLSQALNEPFEMFSPVAIGCARLDETVTAAQQCQEPVATAMPEQSEGSAINAIPEPAQPEEPQTPEITDTKPQPETVSSAVGQRENTDEVDSEAEESEEQPIYQPHANKNTIGILMFIAGLIVGMTIGYFSHNPIQEALSGDTNETIRPVPADIDESDKNTAVTDTIIQETEDTVIVEEKPAEVDRPVVYDTISPTRFLTTMARKYYGQMEYWVFIYEANADNLGNPNRIKPGTRIIIPDKEDFTDGETPEQTLVRAKRIGREIYNRFNN